MELQAVNDRLIVEELPKTDLSIISSGLYRADVQSLADNQLMARVVSCGEGRILTDGSRAPMPAAVGQTVLAAMLPHNAIAYGGKKYYALRDSDIIGVVQG